MMLTVKNRIFLS